MSSKENLFCSVSGETGNQYPQLESTESPLLGNVVTQEVEKMGSSGFSGLKCLLTSQSEDTAKIMKMVIYSERLSWYLLWDRKETQCLIIRYLFFEHMLASLEIGRKDLNCAPPYPTGPAGAACYASDRILRSPLVKVQNTVCLFLSKTSLNL